MITEELFNGIPDFVLAWSDKVNRNGCVYPKHALEKAVAEYNEKEKNKVKRNEPERKSTS